MVNLEVEVAGGEVKEAEIRGDFFLEPPKKLEELENQIIGLSTSVEKSELVERLEAVDVQMIGFSAGDVAEAFAKAVRGEDDE